MTERAPERPATAAVEALIARLADEFEDRRARGEQPDPEEYAARHPEAATLIREVLGVFGLLAGPSGPPANGAVGWGRLGDFRLLSEVGRGGMGVVYEAEQVSLGRRVALKVLPFEATVDPRRVQRFEHEARAAALLHHEHIVPVYAVGSDRGVHYYAMQFIDGRTVADLIAELYRPEVQPAGAATTEPVAAATTVRLPRPREFFRTAAGIAAAAADALEHAHSLGVVHRDVKPGNLLLDRSGKVWVTDFGLARLGAGEGVTLTGDLLGTLRYMAPEQALSKHDLVDHRADIYSLGATLYELLTGAPVVDGADREEILRAIAFDESIPPRRRDRSIPRDLETVVLKCLEKDPARRYASAKELADDLRRFVNSEPVRAKRPTRRQRLAKWAGRNRGAVTTAAVAGVILLVAVTAGAGVAAWQAMRATDAKRQAQDRSEYARRTVDEMYTRFAEQWLSEQPQLTEVQHDFLLRALEFYEEFARESGHEPAAVYDVARARRRIGVIQVKLGRHGEAEPALRRAADLFEQLAASDPTNVDFQWSLAGSVMDLGAVYSETGRLTEAETAYARAITTARGLVRERPAPESLEILTQWLNNMAALLSDSRRPEEALKVWGEAIGITRKLTEDFPDVPSFRYVRAVNLAGAGSQYRQLKRWKEAEEHLREARAQVEAVPPEVQRVPKFRAQAASIASNLGILLDTTGRRTDARWEFEATRRTREGLVEDFPKVSGYRRDLANALMNLATLVSGTGQFDEARTLCRRARVLWDDLVTRHPGVPAYEEGRKLLGVVLATVAGHLGNAGRHDEALTLYEEAVHLNPEHAVAHWGLGLALRRLGRSKEAIASHQVAIHLKPNYAEAHRSLGLNFQDQGKPDDAAACYRRAIELDPANAEACVNLGVILSSRRQWKEAENLFRTAIRGKPALALAHLNLGKLLMSTGRPAEAVAPLRVAVDLGPEDAEANNSLGAAFEKSGEPADAEKHFRKAVRLHPDNASYCFNLGNVLERLGRLDWAERYYRIAIDLNPAEAEAHCNLGQVLRTQGRYREALAAVSKGDELGRKKPGWPYPSEQWVAEAKWLVALEEWLPAFLAGDAQPKNAEEAATLAHMCVLKKLYAGAVRFYREALRREPKWVNGNVHGHRYEGARAAALAGAERGEDAGPLDAAARAALRRQALDWLTAELNLWVVVVRQTGPSANVRAPLREWQTHPDLVGVRNEASLAKLPDAERAVWRKLWARVAELIAASPEMGPQPREVAR